MPRSKNKTFVVRTFTTKSRVKRFNGAQLKTKQLWKVLLRLFYNTCVSAMRDTLYVHSRLGENVISDAVVCDICVTVINSVFLFHAPARFRCFSYEKR